MQSTLDTLTKLAAKIVRRAAEELPPERLLLEEGLLDSMQVIELADAIEDHFPILLDPMELSPEHFSSLSSLLRLIERKLAPSVTVKARRAI
ncbi:MAG: acyl carrier protein [Planctomycetota bacterium]|nr:MAG: acyl carrier protein [Planctomycetota bacterium]